MSAVLVACQKCLVISQELTKVAWTVPIEELPQFVHFDLNWAGAYDRGIKLKAFADQTKRILLEKLAERLQSATGPHERLLIVATLLLGLLTLRCTRHAS